ncbi:Uncharacterised protein [Streptococcus pneumoniae]|nr:Uncharacterised protein [Streptococcus pneumoniae]
MFEKFSVHQLTELLQMVVYVTLVEFSYYYLPPYPRPISKSLSSIFLFAFNTLVFASYIF